MSQTPRFLESIFISLGVPKNLDSAVYYFPYKGIIGFFKGVVDYELTSMAAVDVDQFAQFSDYFLIKK